MLMTAPFRSPSDGCVPMPTMSTPPDSLGSPTMAQIFVVPISRPTISSPVPGISLSYFGDQRLWVVGGLGRARVHTTLVAVGPELLGRLAELGEAVQRL